MKRVYKVGEVYRHKNRLWQRRILKIEGDDIYYHDGFGYGVCHKQRFVIVCPDVVEIADKSFKTAIATMGVHVIQSETANGVYID